MVGCSSFIKHPPVPMDAVLTSVPVWFPIGQQGDNPQHHLSELLGNLSLCVEHMLTVLQCLWWLHCCFLLFFLVPPYAFVVFFPHSLTGVPIFWLLGSAIPCSGMSQMCLYPVWDRPELFYGAPPHLPTDAG